MLARKIEGSVNRLRELAGRIPEEQWEIARRVVAVLDECAEIARNLEAATLPITKPAPTAARQ